MSTTVAGRGWCLNVPHHARGARAARQGLRASLTGLVDADVLVDAAAIASELVGNAVRHAAPLPGDIVTMVWRLIDGGGVEIRVTDGGSAVVPRVLQPTSDAMSGRGLAIVAALASVWGVERDSSRQCVWAQVRGVGRRNGEMSGPLG